MTPARAKSSVAPALRRSSEPGGAFLARPQRDALEALLGGLRSPEPFMLLTGAAGTGKTTVARRLLEQIDPSHHAPGGMFGPYSNGDALLDEVVQDFGIRGPRQGGAFLTLEQFLGRCGSTGREAVLVIDEAQALDEAALRQLWQLAVPPTGSGTPIHVLLVGSRAPQTGWPNARRSESVGSEPVQPEAADPETIGEAVGDGPPLPIGTRVHLRPLQAAETREFVLERLRARGWTGQPPFGPAATQAIHERSGGVLRRISMLCDRILMWAELEGVREVGAEGVEAVDAQLRGEWSGAAAEDRPGAPRPSEPMPPWPKPPGMPAMLKAGAASRASAETVDGGSASLPPAATDDSSRPPDDRASTAPATRAPAVAAPESEPEAPPDTRPSMAPTAAQPPAAETAAGPSPHITPPVDPRIDPHIEPHDPPLPAPAKRPSALVSARVVAGSALLVFAVLLALGWREFRQAPMPAWEGSASPSSVGTADDTAAPLQTPAAPQQAADVPPSVAAAPAPPAAPPPPAAARATTATRSPPARPAAPADATPRQTTRTSPPAATPPPAPTPCTAAAETLGLCAPSVPARSGPAANRPTAPPEARAPAVAAPGAAPAAPDGPPPPADCPPARAALGLCDRP